MIFILLMKTDEIQINVTKIIEGLHYRDKSRET